MTVKKFHILTGPFQVTAKLSDLKYELLSYNGRIFIFYVNCLKSYKEESNQIPKWQRKTRARGDKVSNAKRDAVITLPAILSYPLAGDNSADWDSLSAPSSPIAPPRPVSTPPSAGDKQDEERLDPTYFPPVPTETVATWLWTGPLPRHARRQETTWNRRDVRFCIYYAYNRVTHVTA